MSDDIVESAVEPTEVTPEAVTPPDDATANISEEKQPEVKPERVFTQKELDEILQKRLAKESRKVERYARAEAELRLLKEQIQSKPRENVEPTEPKPNQFNDYESYIAALTDWKVDQKMRGLHEQTLKQRQIDEQTSHASKMRENLIRAADKYEDFEEVVANPSLPITVAMRDAIGESDIAGDVAYYLGTNAKEAERIAALSPIGQVKAILALEAKLKAPEKKLTTDAPEPITPNSNKGQVKKDPFKMTDAEYAKWRKTGKAY